MSTDEIEMIYGEFVFCIAMEIDRLQRSAVTLMKNHASVKAAGVAAAIPSLERLAEAFGGVGWRSLADTWAERRGWVYSPGHGWEHPRRAA